MPNNTKIDNLMYNIKNEIDYSKILQASTQLQLRIPGNNNNPWQPYGWTPRSFKNRFEMVQS